MKTFFILALLVIHIFSQRVIETPGKVEVETSKLALEFTGGSNVPKFTFSGINSTTKYKFQFQQVYQIQGEENFTKKLSSTNIALPSFNWEITKVTQSENKVNFNLTGVKNNQPSFEFRVHIQENSLTAKFDVIVNNMDGKWHADASHLVIAFKLIEQKQGADESNPTVILEGNKAKFGAAFLESNQDAKETETGVVRKAVVKQNEDSESKSPFFYILYEKFNGELVQDPIFGIHEDNMNGENSNGVNPGNSNTSTSIVFSIMLIILCCMITLM